MTKHSIVSRFLTEADRALGNRSILAKATLPRDFVTSSRYIVWCPEAEFVLAVVLNLQFSKKMRIRSSFPIVLHTTCLVRMGSSEYCPLFLGILCLHKIFTPLGILEKVDAKFNFKDMKSGADGEFWH